MGKSLLIDLKERECSTYILEYKKGRYEIKDSQTYPLSDRYDFPLELGTEVIENAYLSLPVSSLNFRVTDLPFSDKDRIREILPFELDGSVLGGSNNVVFDNVILGSSNNTHHVLAVYIEKGVLQEILKRLKSYDIDPVLITSLELREKLKGFSLEKLLSPVSIEDQDRVSIALEEIEKPTINLRRDEFSYTRDIEKTKKSLKMTAVLVICLALIFSAILLVNIVVTRNEIAFLNNEIRKQYQELFPGEKQILNELYQLKSHMKELKGKEEVFIGVTPLNLLLSLSQIDTHKVVFHEITTERSLTTMKGEAPSLSDIQDIKGKLERFFNEVTIADSRSSSGGSMLFTITAKEKTI